MTDTTSDLAAPDAATSQIIEPREADVGAQGRGSDVPTEEAPKEEGKALSSRDAIAKAFDEAKEKSEAEQAPKEEPEEPAKAEKADKPEAEEQAPEKADEKAQKADKSEAEQPAAARERGAEVRQSEGRKHADPPARFLPEATQKWANTPNEVKGEIHRVTQEYEAQLTEAQEKAQKFEEIRQFDEMARQSGRDGVKDSLNTMVRIEQAMQRSPVMGLEMVLRESGIRKQDGSPLSLYDVSQMVARQTPQQFAQNMGQLQQQSQAAPQQQQRGNPEIEGVRTELDSLKSELAAAKVAPIVEQFKAANPDYNALEGQIAGILRSGVIDQLYGAGLTPAQKLEQAYRMAGGQGSSSQSAAPAEEPTHSPATPARPEIDPDGQKSIKGAPASSQTGEAKRKFKSNRDALAAAFDANRL